MSHIAVWLNDLPESSIMPNKLLVTSKLKPGVCGELKDNVRDILNALVIRLHRLKGEICSDRA